MRQAPVLTEPDANTRAIRSVPLFVDLDGALVATNILWESVLLGLRTNPILLLYMPLWLLRGRAFFKRAVARQVAPDIARLPYQTEVIDLLRQQRAQGRPLILASATDRLWAHAVAAYLDLFDAVVASDGSKNLKGCEKLKAIEAYCDEHGYTRFAYLGDAFSDLPIWRQSAEVYAAAPRPSLRKLLAKTEQSVVFLGQHGSRWSYVMWGLRPRHWIKNLLVFVPVFVGHEIGSIEKLVSALFAFIAFSLCASATYLANDLVDIESDRRHPVKRLRPFASGGLPVTWGPPLVLVLLIFSFWLSAWTLPAPFVSILFVYLTTTIVYSLWLKRKVMVDVFLLAGLYTLRILGGGVATETIVSEWLMTFSVFMFTSLAFAKRFSELSRLANVAQKTTPGRGYLASDISLIESIGPATGYLAVLVFALYINSTKVQTLYSNPWGLWLICPLLLYWISRVWILAKRGVLSEDPVVFAIKDRVSVTTGFITLALILVASS